MRLKKAQAHSFLSMKFELRENIFVIGDMHGNLRGLMHALTQAQDKHYLPDGCDVILLGDCGIVREGIPNDYRAANKRAKKRDIRIYLFRGNHDNPAVYKHDWHDTDEQLDHVFVLEDLDEFVFPNGKTGLVIPGAVSVDRCYRWQNNWCWFADELAPTEDKVENKHYDILFGHGGITPPVIKSEESRIFDSWLAYDKNLESDLAIEQDNWNKILSKTTPSRFYFGHYHCSESFEHNGVLCRVCDISEIVPVNYE